jgi:hypothetical protein
MSAPITEAHRRLAQSINGRWCSHDEGAQLIADSEARAVVEIAMVAAESADRNVSLRLERDELRGALALGQQNCDDAYDDLRAERDAARAEVERLKADGAASAFVNMASRASRAETDRNNLRADLDAIKAILNEEKARAERAEAEVAAERARLRDLWCEMALEYRDERISYVSVQITRSVWDELDAAMKEDAK